jgi:AcrR family transcriptional regulator
MFEQELRSRAVRNRRTQAERSESTQQLLISTGRRLFTERGFEATSTEELAREAGLTRGALYHHFDGKRALFQAVFELVEQEIHQRVLEAVGAADPAQPFWRVGVEAFLDGCMDPAAQRIVLLDAPSVLGWEAWREIDSSYFLGLMIALVNQGMDSGQFIRLPAEPIAQMLMGALTEAALSIARAQDVTTARAEFGAAAAALIEGLQTTPRPS